MLSRADTNNIGLEVGGHHFEVKQSLDSVRFRLLTQLQLEIKRKGSDLRANWSGRNPSGHVGGSGNWTALKGVGNAMYYTILSNFVDIWNLFVCLFLAFQRFLNATKFKLGAIYMIAYCISWLFAFKIGVCSINFNLLFFDEQRYHAYFMEEVDSWMIISAGSFLCLSPSFCFCFCWLNFIYYGRALISSVQLVFRN